MPVSFPFDPAGTNPLNIVENEVHTINGAIFQDYKLVIPNHAPFFIDDFAATKTIGPDTTPLVENVDFSFTLPYVAGTRTTGKPMYGAILLHTASMNGTVNLTAYRTIGGDYTADRNFVLTWLANKIYNPGVAYWDAIQYYPVAFPPGDHYQDWSTFMGQEDLVSMLGEVRDAIAASTLDVNAILESFYANNPQPVLPPPVLPLPFVPPPTSSNRSAPTGTYLKIQDGNIPPNDALVADGSLVEQIQYPDLFNHIGYDHTPLDVHPFSEALPAIRQSGGNPWNFYANPTLELEHLSFDPTDTFPLSGISLPSGLGEERSNFRIFADKVSLNDVDETNVVWLGGEITNVLQSNAKRWFIQRNGLIAPGISDVAISPPTATSEFDLPNPRKDFSILRAENLVIVIGGVEDTGGGAAVTNSVICSDAVRVNNAPGGAWVNLPNLPEALTNVSSFLYRGMLYVVGGEKTDTTLSNKIYRMPIHSAPVNTDFLSDWADGSSLGITRGWEELDETFIGGDCAGCHSFVYGDSVFFVGGEKDVPSHDVPIIRFGEDFEISSQELAIAALPDVANLDTAMYVLLGRMLLILGNFPSVGTPGEFDVHVAYISGDRPYRFVTPSDPDAIIPAGSTVPYDFSGGQPYITNSHLYIFGHAANRAQVCGFNLPNIMAGDWTYDLSPNDYTNTIPTPSVIEYKSMKPWSHQSPNNTTQTTPIGGGWDSHVIDTSALGGEISSALPFIHENRVYLFGGARSFTNQNLIRADIDGSGHIVGPWVDTQTSLTPGAGSFIASDRADIVSVGSSFYLFYPHQGTLVRRFGITAGGSVVNITELSVPSNLNKTSIYSLSAANYKNNLYVLANQTNSPPLRADIVLYRVVVDQGGNLSNWTQLSPPFPSAVWSKAELFVAGNKLYMIQKQQIGSGEWGLFKTTISEDGSIAGWEKTSQPDFFNNSDDTAPSVFVTASRAYVRVSVGLLSAPIDSEGNIGTFAKDDVFTYSWFPSGRMVATSSRLYNLSSSSTAQYKAFAGGSNNYVSDTFSVVQTENPYLIRDIHVNGTPWSERGDWSLPTLYTLSAS